MGGSNRTSWPQERDDLLLSLVKSGVGSYQDIAARINATFGTRLSRNAAIGRARRMGLCKPAQYGESKMARANRIFRDREKKRVLREKRHAANPALALRKPRVFKKPDGRTDDDRKTARSIIQNNGASTTSPEYRRHHPRLPEMTRSELRAMLTQALQNTAAMEVT